MVAQRKSVNNMLRDVILAALSFLSALSMREVLVACVDRATPPGTKNKLVFIVFIALAILMLTVVLAIVWT